MTQKQTQAKTLLTALENYYPSYFGSDNPISSNFKIQQKVYPKKWVLEETFRLAEIPQDSSDIGVAIRKLEEIYAGSINETPAPEYVSNTTLTGKDLEEKMRQAEIRKQQSKQSRENQTKTVADFIKQNQERIAKAQAVQDKLKDKVVYAKVVLPEPLPLDEIEKQDLDTLRASAQGDVETKQKLIDDLAKQIETKLENVPEEQKVLIARTAAVEIVEKLAKPEKAYQAQIQNSILTVIHEDKGQVVSTVLNKDDELLIAAKNGSTLLELEYRNKNLITRNISKNILGLKLTSVICGPEQFEVVLSETKIEGQTTHQVDFEGLNQSYLRLLEKQNSILNSAKEFKFDGEQNFFTEQARTYISEKMAGIPSKGISKRSHSKHGDIFARHGLPNTIVLNTTKNVGRFGELLIKISPNTTSPLLSIAGRIAENEFIKPVVGLFTKGVVVGTGAGGISTTIATTIGVATSWVTAGLSLIGAFIVKKISDKEPQTKNWIDTNKMLIGLGTSLGVMGFFGPVPAIITGGLFLTATGTLSSFVSGALGMLRVIGMSIGMAIATPVIIAVVALVPLVAFIMLVINNSAYVVPPSLTEFGIGRISSPYIDITKTASPAGPLTNANLPKEITYTVTIKAKKSSLTNVKITDTCQVISRDDIPCPTFNIPSAPTSISPATPYTFTYTAVLDAKFKDSVVINTIIVTADTVEQSGATAEMSNSLTIGNPPISCPVPGAKPLNSMNYSYNYGSNTGHGSTAYWDAMGSRYSYALPQSTGCMKPGDCPYYGYAYDVFPNGTTEVFAPSVLGKDVNWNCSYAFSNGGGSAGHTFHCTSTGSNYLLVLTHMNKNAKTGLVKSGEKIGTLYNQGTNTHLHLEFQLSGKWEKPENYFCK